MTGPADSSRQSHPFTRPISHLERTSSLSEAIESAINDHRAGRTDAAEAGYRRVLAMDPMQFDALHLLGVLHHERGEYRVAIELITRAVAQEPLAYPAFFNMGRAYIALDDLDKARACFAQAIQLNPDYPEAYENLAFVCRRQGDADCELRAFERVASLRPESAEARNNLGCALNEARQFDAARASYARALELDPNLSAAAYNLGELMRLLNRHAQSIPYYRQAISLKPDYVDAYYALGIVLHTQGLRTEAIQCMRTALNLNPEHVESRWAFAMFQLPLVHELGEPRSKTRANFARELRELDDWFSGARVNDGHRAVGSQQPFYLAYYDENNLELLSAYGDLCARLMCQWYDQHPFPTAHARTSGQIKLAIVSGHIYDHSVWAALTRGIFEELDHERFSLHVFYTSIAEDHQTHLARSLSPSFHQGHKTLQQWVDALVELQPDAILYPEIGMDHMTARLAALRLAPVQLTSWGQPMTTGLPTIDYFLSASAFEPDDGEEHYRERLVALPNLGCCYRSLDVDAQAANVEQWGIDGSEPLLLCAGTPYKYAPEHDHIYVEIARRLKRAKFIFFTDVCERLSQIVQHRLGHAFEEAGLDPRRFLRLIPRQERPAFFALMQHADVYLDTIGFSGFNTAMQAIECGLPIVTQWGRFMRGRLAAGILARMELGELVTRTDAQYVDLAVKLCQDAGFRANVRQRIEGTRHVLFNDTGPVRAFEDLLVDLTRKVRA